MLLARPQQYPDECVVSYLIRVSQQNGFSHVGELFNCAGLGWKNNRIPIRTIIDGNFDLTRYLEKLGLQNHKVQNTTSKVYASFRRTVDTSHVFVREPKICPECISEDGYCNKNWVYLPIVACVRHKRLLVDVDVETGKKLGWYRRKLDGSTMSSNSVMPKSRAATSVELDISLYFESLIAGKPVVPLPALSGLEFRDALSLFNFICHFKSRLGGTRFKPVGLENNSLSRQYVSVWETLSHWPNAFYEILDGYIDSPMCSRGVGGINRHFRDMRDSMYRQRENKGIQKVKMEFDRYIETRWPGYVDENRLSRLNVNTDDRDIISKVEAARILSCRTTRISKLVGQEKITVTDFKGKEIYSRKEVTELANLILCNWTMKQACCELELTRYQLKQLLDSGIFPAIQKPDSLNRDWIVDKQKCQRLISDLLKSGSKEKCIGGRTMWAIQRKGLSIVQLVEGMQVGRIQYFVEIQKGKSFSFKQFVEFKGT